MNDEEAIKFLKHVKESQKHLEDCKTTRFFKKENEAIETVLQSLEEKYKYKYLYQKVLDDLIKSDKENYLLKKQVNLMSKYISNLDIDEDICKKIENNCDDFNKENKCIDCVKQYFKRLVKEKGE